MSSSPSLAILAATAEQRAALSAAAGELEVVESLALFSDAFSRLAALSPDAIVIWHDGTEQLISLCERISSTANHGIITGQDILCLYANLFVVKCHTCDYTV